MKKKSLATYILFALFILQFLAIAFFNLTQLDKHIGIDTSTYFFQTIETWRQKSLILSDWEYQTTFAIDSPVPLAALFYGICGNVFIAYGLANTILSGVFLFVLFRLIRYFKMSDEAMLIVLNLAECLHFSDFFDNYNSLEYGSVLLIQNGAYVVKTIIALLIILSAVTFIENKKNIPLLCVTGVLVFICSMSSGFWLFATVIVPMILWRVIKKALEKNWIGIFKDKIFIFLAALVFVSFAGQYVMVVCLDHLTIDSTMNMVTLETFWDNIHAVVLGYLELTGSLPLHETSVLSSDGIMMCMYLTVAVITIVAVIRYIKKIAEDEKVQSLYSVMFGNIALYLICNTLLGARFFEVRYLVVFYLLATIILGRFIDSDMFERFGRRQMLALITVTLFALNLYSDLLYYNKTINNARLNGIIASVKQCDVDTVYFYGLSNIVYARDLRALDSDNVYKLVIDDYYVYHWGDTLRNDDWMTGSRKLIIYDPAGETDLPAHVLEGSTVYSEDIEGYVFLLYDGAIPEFNHDYIMY
ncbi:MAG: hypothetical protein J5685_07110 [Clostridiales bacterium]|nr:hypothetical protein [Clostridiales bacterium]